jgi:site-specific recombinase XerD
MVLLAGTTGLRRSELLHSDGMTFDFEVLQVEVNKSCVRGKLGQTKTAASAKPIPIHMIVADALKEWKQFSPYHAPEDFLFPSIRMNGWAPVWPDMVLQKIIQPVLDRAGIKGKRVAWHTLRQSLATNLRSLGVNVKVTQELLRHANSRTTLDIYTQAVSADKREASGRLVGMLVGAGENGKHPSAPSNVLLASA